MLTLCSTLVRFYQTRLFIQEDVQLYDEKTDSRCITNALDITDALGQVDILFTDKTGTLTSNEMALLHFSTADGTIYDIGGSVDTRLQQLKWKKDLELDHLITLLATCHTVIPVVEDTITYQSTSIDEEALVKGARSIGIGLVERSNHHITVRIGQDYKRFQILHVLEFTFERKRMSLLVRDDQGQVRLMCKGADNVVQPLLREDQEFLKCLETVLQFSSKGLRTLLCAERIIPEKVYRDWNKRLIASEESTDRKSLVHDLMCEIECNLTLLGATAIEDKLQDKVPETIVALREAGIRTWMLTGDKRETACVIARSCALLDNETKLYELDHWSSTELEEAVQEYFEKTKQELDVAFAIVIDGNTLELLVAEEKSPVRAIFLQWCLAARSIICYRVSPDQKAIAVNLIKKNLPKVVTLAIGDGANDVSMLKVANIGVGIIGKEGLQAVNASDYSIAQFSFLKRLLLVHGRWNYRRVSKIVLLQMYMLVALQFGQLWYFFFNGSTGYVSCLISNCGSYFFAVFI
jgi:phospholipid-translocating P-type ATPase (flippase)